jgi:uncharacterized alkaline shock family protein YloU
LPNTGSNQPKESSASGSSDSPPGATGPSSSSSEGSSRGRGSSGQQRGGSLERSSQRGASLESEHGTTSISSSVVAKIAWLATREIPGVQAMGKAMSRAFGTFKAKLPGATESTEQGVSVEVGEHQAAVDIDIVAYYGESIVETATAIRENVIDRIESMTGLEVVEVNVNIDDLYVGDHDDSQDARVE